MPGSKGVLTLIMCSAFVEKINGNVNVSVFVILLQKYDL